MTGQKPTAAQSRRGVGPAFLLFLLFLGLKLGGAIAWSWWWVTAPLWAPVVLAVVIVGIAALVVATASRR